MLHWITHLVGAGGYWGVAALMAIASVVLFVPTELIMAFAGFAVAQGQMTLFGATLAGAGGGALGTLPLYAVSRWLGRHRGRAWIERHGRWLRIRKADLDRVNDQFERRGLSAVFLSQLLPGVRGLIATPAGFARMNVAVFLVANFLGTIIWCAALASIGRVLGPRFARVDDYLGPTGWVILGAIAAGIVALVIRRRAGSRTEVNGAS